MDGDRATIPLDGTNGRPAEDISKVAFAQALRGWAAISVVVAHLAMGFWMLPQVIGALIALPMPESAAPPIVTQVLKSGFEHLPGPASRFGLGPFGVALFFLISGFVIPFSFRRQSRVGFLAGRALRLWPTYAAGLSITLLALCIGAISEGQSFPYTARQVLANYALGLRDLLWVPSINGIVWTLEIEIKFYLLCACAATWLRTGKTRIFYIAAAVAAAVVLALAGRHDAWAAAHPSRFAMAWVAAVDAQMMLYMLIGTVFHYLYRGWLRPVHAAALALGMFALFVQLNSNGYLRTVADTTAVSYAAALVLFTASYLVRHRFRGGGVSGWLADISYPLYAVHGVGGYVLMNLMVRNGVSSDVTLAVAFFASLLLAWAIHVAIEKPTHRLATRISRALSPQPAATTAVPLPRSLAA